MGTKFIQSSLNAGELSPGLDARTDLAKYYNGATQMSNAIALPQGGAIKRPGGKWIAKAKGPCVVLPFSFSASDSMILEAGEEYMRFFKDSDRVMTDSVTIVGITLTPGSEVAIEATTHLLSTGDIVRFTGVTGTTKLNYVGLDTEFTVTRVDADNFTLDGTDGIDYNTWESAGTVAAIYEIATPYSATEVFEMHISPVADVIRIAHEDYLPRKLTRLADNSWTIATIEPSTGPFLDQNTTTTKTLQTSKTSVSGYYIPSGTAAITLTAAGHTPFVAAHVGAYFCLKHTRADNTASLTATGTSSGVRTKGAFSISTSGYSTNAVVDLQRKVGDGDYQSFRQFTAATTYAGTEPDDDVYYRLVVSVANATAKFVAQDQTHRGIVKVTAYTSTTIVTVEAITDIYFNNGEADNITSEWSEGAWSAVKFYPRAITMHEDRVWYGGTTTSPQTLWSTKTGEYDNFTRSDGLYDNEAVIVEINDPDVSQIEWIASFNRLFVGTSKKEYMISANDPNDPITPSDRRSKIQSSYGSAHTQPIVLDNGIMYVQRTGRVARFVTLNEYGDRQESSDINRLTDHIFESAPKQLAVQNTPHTIVWVPREDGQACPLVWNPVEDVLAWSRCVTGATTDTPTEKYKSFAVIPGTTEDQVWYAVYRRINGTLVTYIEQFAPRPTDDIGEALMLDSAKVVGSSYDKQNIIVASDTIRYSSGAYGSGPYGGMI